MNAILRYVRENGTFEPPQHKGGYDSLAFTHLEYLQFVESIEQKHADRKVDRSSPELFDGEVAAITCWVIPFEVEGEHFALRHLEMGEHIDQTMTKAALEKQEAHVQKINELAAKCADVDEYVTKLMELNR